MANLNIGDINSLFAYLTSINGLKTHGMMTKNFMFSVVIPYLPTIGNGVPFSFLIKGTSIPPKDRDSTVVYTRFGSFTVPNGAVWGAHEWPVTIMLPEGGDQLLKLAQWFNNIDNFPLSSLKTDATVTLLNLDKKPTNHVFIIEGIYPKKKFGIEGLSMDNVEGYITFDEIFAFDQIRLLGESV